MNLKDLTNERLIELGEDGGSLRSGSQRVQLLDPMLLGGLHRNLVENLGPADARSTLTCFGWALGWQIAGAMQTEFTWEREEDRRNAGPRLLELDGLLRLAQSGAALREEGLDVLGSVEAESHLELFGAEASPTCWVLCGVLSGYLSHATGEDLFVLEDRCVGMGHEHCRMQARTREAWGEAYEAELRYFTPSRSESAPQVFDVPVAELDESSGLVARSSSMRATLELARRVAKVDARVLITGESGSGKERIARLVHEASMRSSGPFVAVNCGAISETLLESELFGHARGAFTGATQDRVGLFEAAHRGTLLLDEIGEISQNMQVKLLRVLQEHELRRVGETKNRSVDVRVLAATNRDLAQRVAEGSFRQDLYYRLKVVEIAVPPLRERQEDVLPLAQQLLNNTAQREKRTFDGFAQRAGEQLLRYGWPGNVRELENVVERAVALAQGHRVEFEDLPGDVCAVATNAAASEGSVRALKDIEREYIIAALEKNDGNQTNTARQLKIGAATLYRRLKQYGLIADRKRS